MIKVQCDSRVYLWMQIYGKITDISKPIFDINGLIVHRFLHCSSSSSTRMRSRRIELDVSQRFSGIM